MNFWAYHINSTVQFIWESFASIAKSSWFKYVLDLIPKMLLEYLIDFCLRAVNYISDCSHCQWWHFVLSGTSHSHILPKHFIMYLLTVLHGPLQPSPVDFINQHFWVRMWVCQRGWQSNMKSQTQVLTCLFLWVSGDKFIICLESLLLYKNFTMYVRNTLLNMTI